jgi:hypothetical protein
MKVLKLLSIIILFIGCGGTGYEKNPLDMWLYMTPDRSIDVNYIAYENGKETDFFTETVKVFSSGTVERVSGEDKTTLIPYSDKILEEEPNGDRVEIKRLVYVGDKNVFQSPSIRLCTIDDFFENFRTKDMEFYNVIKVHCISNSGVISDIYYGYDEGIVYLYRNENGSISEVLKIRDTQLE